MSDDTTNVTSLPEQGLVIDLDSIERKDAKPPFKAKIGDRVITMIDPQEVDWRDLLNMQDPREFLRLALSVDDREFLSNQDIPGWKFGQLMEAFYRHYDLEELANQARRQQALRPV
jgi:hypothetical protein